MVISWSSEHGDLLFTRGPVVRAFRLNDVQPLQFYLRNAAQSCCMDSVQSKCTFPVVRWWVWWHGGGVVNTVASQREGAGFKYRSVLRSQGSKEFWEGTAGSFFFFVENAGQIAASFGLFLFWSSTFSSYVPLSVFSFSFLSFPLNNVHIVE